MTRFRLDAERCELTATAHSTLHPVRAVAEQLNGWVEATLVDGQLDLDNPVTARFELPMSALRVDNPLLGRELDRRLEIRRYPVAIAEVEKVSDADAGRYEAAGQLTLHGERQPVRGTAELRVGRAGELLVDGQLQLDIRDFGLRPPSMFGLKVRPEVEVTLRIVAVPRG